MIYSPDFFPLWLNLTLAIFSVFGLGVALFNAPWSAIREHSDRQHLVFGAAVVLALFWMLKVDALEILAFHPIGVTAVTLLIGWSFAVVAGAVAQLILLAFGFDHWTMVASNFFVTTLIPASVSFLVVSFTQRIRLKNIFVFLLGAGFMGGALSAFAVALSNLALFFLSGYGYWFEQLWREAPIVFLLMFPEGFINGTVISALAVFKPHWVKTFNEDFYLGKE